MKSKVSNLQLLNNTEHRVKFKTGSDIVNVKDPIVGELFLETSRQDDISFDGQSKIDTDYTFGGGELSLSAWINTTKGRFIIATDSPSGGNNTSFAIGFGNSTTAYVLIGNPSQETYKESASIGSPINDGNWHNVIVTIDNSNVMNFYIDGVLETTHTFSIAPGTSSFVTHYGSGWTDGEEPFYDTWGLDGQLNGLGIWERVLTDKEINTISSSGRYSPSPSHFSPDLWVGSTDPALYTCTDTSGTISKVADLTAKMGDIPFLRANSSKFSSTNSVPLWGEGLISSTYSFWFYDDGVGAGSSLIFDHDSGDRNSYVLINHDNSTVELREHLLNGNEIIHNSLLAYTGTGNNIFLKYENNKLNNIIVVNQAVEPYPIKFYFNGELVAEAASNASYYPGQNGFKSLNPDSQDSKLLIGDCAFWDTDAGGIANQIYSPNQGHEGFQGDWRNISIPPKHYWKFGSPMDSGQVKDIGIDGTNHFTPDTVSSNQYEYKNIFGVDRSLEV